MNRLVVESQAWNYRLRRVFAARGRWNRFDAPGDWLDLYVKAWPPFVEMQYLLRSPVVQGFAVTAADRVRIAAEILPATLLQNAVHEILLGSQGEDPCLLRELVEHVLAGQVRVVELSVPLSNFPLVQPTVVDAQRLVLRCLVNQPEIVRAVLAVSVVCSSCEESSPRLAADVYAAMLRLFQLVELAPAERREALRERQCAAYARCAAGWAPPRELSRDELSCEERS